MQEGQQVSLIQALEHYKTIYMPSRNLAPRTRIEYATDIEDLIAFLGQNDVHDVGQVSLNHLERYLAELDRRGQTGATRRRKASSITSFFDFLRSANITQNNPAEKLVLPRRESHQPRVLSEPEYKRLLRACAHETRDAAIIELLLQTGIRLSELANLTVDDIELPSRITQDPTNVGTLRIRNGKGRKDRTIALNFKACKALKTYLTVRPKVEHDAVFITKFGRPPGPRGYQALVKKYLKEAGIKGASVHTLRHTFGTHHVAKGTSLRTVQEALGHADLKTTSIYVSLAREVMDKEMQEHAL